MKVVYKNNLIDLNSLEILGSGIEGLVYEYDNEALKVFNHDINKWLLNHDTVVEFSKIQTTHILLPRHALYNQAGNYIGYSTKLIENNIALYQMWETLSDNLEEQRQIIEDDLQILNENGILIGDLEVNGNFIYNGQMYFIDPGSFRMISNSHKKIETDNRIALNNALHSQLFLLGRNLENIEEELSQILNEDIPLDENLFETIMQIYSQPFENEYIYDNYFDYLMNIISEYGCVLEYKRELLTDALYCGCYEDNQLKSLKKILR